ncbi:MAG: hypothetical protein KAS78_04100 [Candidatus Pacebacteria bacterium]|nr:hypothetical protein [Candidatus Paceibacterota bacterium]
MIFKNKEDLVVLGGSNNSFTKRSFGARDVTVICGGCCITCSQYLLVNPGCKIRDQLSQISSKFWNHLLVIEDS